jgi:hypothetical protein
MKTYIGIDWGSRINLEDKSATSVCILKIDESKSDTPSVNDLLGMEIVSIGSKLYEEQVSEIERLIISENADGIVADIGYGQVQCQMLQSKFGEKVKSCYYSPTEIMKYNSDMWMVSVSRDHMIELAMRKVGIPFRRPMIGNNELHALNYAYIAYVVGLGEISRKEDVVVA